MLYYVLQHERLFMKKDTKNCVLVIGITVKFLGPW